MQRAVPLRQLQARLSSELARAAGLLHAWSDRLAGGDPNPTRGSGRAGATSPLDARVAAARAQGAPEHWLDLVRTHAPDLLEGGGLRVSTEAPDHPLPRPAPPPPPDATMTAAVDARRAGARPSGGRGDDGRGDTDPADTARSVARDDGGPEPLGAPTPTDADRAATDRRDRRLVHRARRALAAAIAPGGPRAHPDPPPRADRRPAAPRHPVTDPGTDVATDLATVRGTSSGSLVAPTDATGSDPSDTHALGRTRSDAVPLTPALDIEPPSRRTGGTAAASAPTAFGGDRHPRASTIAAGRPEGDGPRPGVGGDDRSGAALGHRAATGSRDDTTDRLDATGRADGLDTRSPAAGAIDAPATTTSGRAFRAPVPAPLEGPAAERGPASHARDGRNDGAPAGSDRLAPVAVRAVPDDPRDRWPDLPAGAADPRDRDHRDRAARPSDPDGRWPALPDEDDRWLVDPGPHPATPLATVGGRAGGGAADRDHAAELDAEQRGR